MVEHAKHPTHLTDTHQSSWALAIIQIAAAISLPAISSSLFLASQYSLSSCLLVITTSNIILFLIRFCLIKLSFSGRKSTLDLTYDCFGKFGAILVSIALLADTIAWFFVHTSIAGTIAPLSFLSGTNGFFQTCILIGIASTFLCMNGMKVLRILSMIFLPLLSIGFLFLCIQGATHFTFRSDPFTWSALSSLSTVLGTSIGFSVDIPTFFRHRNSWKSALQGLSIFQTTSFVIGILALFMANSIFTNTDNYSFSNSYNREINGLIFIVFTLFSSLYSNIYNIYSSSVAWEVVAPKALVGRKEYMIIGFSLAIILIMFIGITDIGKSVLISDCFMINLCFALVALFLSSFNKKPSLVPAPGGFLACWCVCGIVNILQISGKYLVNFDTTITSISFFLLLFIIKTAKNKVLSFFCSK